MAEPRFPAVPAPAVPAPAVPAPARSLSDDSLEPPPVYSWRPNAVLFVLTVLSVFFMGALWALGPTATPYRDALLEPWRGWQFALPLLSILIAHEFGHWIAAKIHGVPASLPYFLPLPWLSPFGTMGAVIAMPRRIKSRNALLDIGAAGPLAGMVVAVPVLALGLSLSSVRPGASEHFVQEGQSILYWLLKHWVLGPIPPGHDVFLHPTALAGWAGFLVTMINLLPWGQLDGGHIAYALFGELQDRLARLVRLSLFGLFLFNLQIFLIPVLNEQSSMSVGDAVMNSLFWLIWAGFLGVLSRLSGDEHPPTEPGTLTPVRKVVAIASLLLFVILFMPTPWAVY